MAFVTPTDVATGEVLTASRYNQDVVANFAAIGGPWTAYTPTWTNLTVGNATQASAYINAGKLYIVRIGLQFGSTTSISGSPEFTLPDGVSVNSSYYDTYVFGTGSMRDDSAGFGFTSPILRSTTTAGRLRFATTNAAGTYARNDVVSATIPFTWATSDRIEGQFFFEAA